MNSILRSLAGGLILFLLMLSTARAEETYELDIADQELSSALKQFAEQSGLQVVYFADLANGKQAKGVHGTYSADAALTKLLDYTDLTYSTVDDRTYAIATQATAEDAGGDSEAGNGETAGEMPKPVMMAQAVAEQNQTSRTTETDSYEEEKKWPLEEIIVTGTNIRGIAPESSPVHVYDREDIEISGAGTVQDFIQTLPQNFGGGSNADTGFGLPNDVNSQFNSGTTGSLGSSVNLRGLGSGSTLVLLNGHRLAPSSGIGDFVDISMIPASAIDRVEILTDGASSIYGADAVAGVVNIVLREDFEGVETSFRYGTVTEGDLDEYRASITGGKNWNTGNALFVYEYFKQGNLSAADRSFSQGAVLPLDILPSQERHSALASATQKLGTNLKIFGDVLFSTREAERDRTNLLGEFRRVTPSSRNLNVSGGGSWKVSGNWILDISGTFNDVHSEPLQIGSLGLVQNSRTIDSTIWTADAIASGTLFRLLGGDVKLAIGGHYRSEDFTNFEVDQDEIDRQADRDVYAVFGEAFFPIIGSNNAIPGVDRLEINVSGRFEDFSDFGSTANPKVGVLWAPSDALALRGSYSKSFKPPPLGRVGATDTTVTALSTALLNGIFGLPPGDPSIEDVVVLTVFGTGDDLDAETSKAFTAGLDFNQEWGRHNLLFETTWFDIEFENRLGQTPIPDGRTPSDAPNIAFNNPELFPEGTVIFSPSQSQISDLLDSADSLVALEDPLAAEIINFAQVVRNLTRTSVSGFDIGVAYTNEFDAGTFSLGLDGTYLVDFKQQGADTSPIVEEVNTLYNPSELKLRGRAGFAYGGFAANIFVNYTGDYRVDNTAGAMRIDSWTTADFSLSYDTRERLENAILNNTILRLSVLNAFNEDPPATPSNPQFLIFGFDPTNASPLNRFLAIELTKRF